MADDTNRVEEVEVLEEPKKLPQRFVSPLHIASQKSKKQKRIKRVLPKELDASFIGTLEQIGMACHDNQSIAAYLGCSVEEVRERRDKDAEFDQAILRGKVKLLHSSAIIVASSIQGTKLQGPGGVQLDPTDTQVKAAMFYLEKHGPGWLKD